VRRSLALLTLALCASACSRPELAAVDVKRPQPLEIPEAIPADPIAPRPFVRIQTSPNEYSKQPISLHLQDATLAECITRAEPRLNIVPATPHVDLSRRYDVRANELSLGQYLNVLEGLSGYALELEPSEHILYVSAYLTRSWDVSTFAGQGQSHMQVGGSIALSSGASGSDDEDSGSDRSGSSAIVTYYHQDSPWDDLLNNARSILGIDGSIDAAMDESSGSHTWLVADRRLGLLRARGPVARIQQLDAWLEEQIRRGARQVLLAVAILDITREKGDSAGLDLDLLYQGMDQYVQLRRTIPNPLSFTSTGGAWQVNAALEFGRWSLNAIVQQLSQQGMVTIRSDPIFTVVNGMTTFLGDGEEISFIANTEFNPGEYDGVPILTTEFEHIRVGFRIAVTPRMRRDGTILVEVVPVLSSIRSQSTFDTGISTIVRPNIAIQEMATLALTRSGKPILLGGLIQSRVREAAHRLPCDHFLCDAFASATLEQDNRELMIVITPIEVAI